MKLSWMVLGILVAAWAGGAQEIPPNGRAVGPQDHPPATSEIAPQLSGTVVDTSGAAIAGASVQVQSANGTVQTTQSDDERLLHYFRTPGR